VKQSAVDPDPKKAYVIGLHPHGIFAVSAFCNIVSNPNAFPGLDYRLVTVSINFRVPFWRDVLMGMGLVDADRESCGALLDRGISVCIVVGGAAESLDARPGHNDLTLARRLGFVRIAIEHGADLIPVFSFGENQLYKQMIPNPPGSKVRAFQDQITDTLGFTVPIVRGRSAGLGIVPYRRPILTVIGKPVPVPHIPDPTLETVLEVHERYVAALRELYYEYRHMAGETSDLNVGEAPRAEELERIRMDLERVRERRRAMQLAGGITPDSEDFRFRQYGLEDEFVKAQGGVQSVAYAERIEGFEDESAVPSISEPPRPPSSASNPESQSSLAPNPASHSASDGLMPGAEITLSSAVHSGPTLAQKHSSFERGLELVPTAGHQEHLHNHYGVPVLPRSDICASQGKLKQNTSELREGLRILCEPSLVKISSPPEQLRMENHGQPDNSESYIIDETLMCTPPQSPARTPETEGDNDADALFELEGSSYSDRQTRKLPDSKKSSHRVLEVSFL